MRYPNNVLQRSQFLPMTRSEAPHQPSTLSGQMHLDSPGVGPIPAFADQPAGGTSIDQRHRAMVTCLQPPGQFTDTGPSAIDSRPDMQQEQILSGSNACGARCLLAEAHEPCQAEAEFGQRRNLLAGNCHGYTYIIA